MKINGTTLEIDLIDFVQGLNGEARAILGRELCAEDLAFEAICDALVDNSFFDDGAMSWWSLDRCRIEKLRAKLSPMMANVAAALVASLMKERDQAVLLERQARAEYWDLYHAWPNGSAKPPRERYKFPHVRPLSESAVRASLEERVSQELKPSELETPCGICGGDAAKGWLKCREHFVADIKKLETLLADATKGQNL